MLGAVEMIAKTKSVVINGAVKVNACFSEDGAVY